MDQLQNNEVGRSSIEWESEDFIYHPKNFLWYLGTIAGSVVISLIPWLISGFNDYISSGVIFIALISLIAYAARKPKMKKYRLNTAGIHIDGQNFSMLDFSYYWVEKFETYTQITLVGRKRTAMPVGIYSKDEELTKRILDIIQKALPQTNPSQNPADWLARKLKL